MPKCDIHRKKFLLRIWWDMKNILYYELLLPATVDTAASLEKQLLPLNHEMNQEHLFAGKVTPSRKMLYDNTRLPIPKLVKDAILTLR